MLAFIALWIGIATGAACVLILLHKKARALANQKKDQDANVSKIQDTIKSLRQQEEEINAKRLPAIEYEELLQDNLILRQDLNNLYVLTRKTDLEVQSQREQQNSLRRQCDEVASRLLTDTTKWVMASLTQNNYAVRKQQLQSAIKRCRDIGFDISQEDEEAMIVDIKDEFERIVRVAFERQEQIRIKAQIREEIKLEREIEKELQQVEREKSAIQIALDKALADTQEEHSEQIEQLRARLAEAEARSERTKSRAQLTKAGHVYVISNIGSFGTDVYKIGMTRRLEPLDRVKELGDASVPFSFDVHMMISTNDAPALENALHRTFHQNKVNKINPRKEFFRINIDAIIAIVEKEHGKVEYIADAEALEFRQSTSMTEDDADFIEGVYDSLKDEHDNTDLTG